LKPSGKLNPPINDAPTCSTPPSTLKSIARTSKQQSPLTVWLSLRVPGDPLQIKIYATQFHLKAEAACFATRNHMYKDKGYYYCH
jgi:hypothetical protein